MAGSLTDSALDAPYALPAEAPDRFARDGYVRLPGLLAAATLAPYRDLFARLAYSIRQNAHEP